MRKTAAQPRLPDGTMADYGRPKEYGTCGSLQTAHPEVEQQILQLLESEEYGRPRLSLTDLRVESLRAISVGSSLALTKVRLADVRWFILTVEVDFTVVRCDLRVERYSGYGRVTVPAPSRKRRGCHDSP